MEGEWQRRRVECEFLSPFIDWRKKKARDRRHYRFSTRTYANENFIRCFIARRDIYLARKLNQNYSYINGLRLIQLGRSDLLMLIILIDFAGRIADKLKSGAKCRI